MLLAGLSLSAQITPTYNINSDTHGDTIDLAGQGAFIRDDDAFNGSEYSQGQDRWVTIKKVCTEPYLFSVQIMSFDVGPKDTLYIYDGPTINSPVLLAANNAIEDVTNRIFYASVYNTTNMLTIRLVTHTDTAYYGGFAMDAECRLPCETVVPHIDSMYFKLRNGVIIDTNYIKPYIVLDSAISVDVNGDTTVTVTEQKFRGVELCLGEDLMLTGYGTYTHDYGLYYPTDATTLFKWQLGNGDTSYVTGGTTVTAHYKDLDCYDVVLTLVDEQGCISTQMETVRVRLAQNPIKTLYDLQNICNSDSLLVNVGYEGGNGTITLKHITFEKLKTKTRECKTFLPDGDFCGDGCFTASVVFDDFPAGRKVNSKEDICSICVNYEHEFMGDYRLAIICPTGQRAVMKYKDQTDYANINGSGHQALPGTHSGGGMFTGYPYAGDSHHSYESNTNDGAAAICDSLQNYFGVGLDYCFSRNPAYVLVNGDAASTSATNSNQYLANTTEYVDNITYTFSPIPAPYTPTGADPGTKTFSTKHPSNHEEKTDYYNPADDFSTLVGCPLNGQWNIQVCDLWHADNGWIFNWSMDICGISSGVGCEYQVGIDSVTWIVDSSYGDFDLGYFRGLKVQKRDSINSYISTPDTAGYFGVNVTIYDEFGCVWDSAVHISSVWTPKPDLGPDTLLICDVEHAILDAKDVHSATSAYEYMWAPFGQTTDTLHTQALTGSSTLYTVEVMNTDLGMSCRTRDSVRVNINRQPMPNFDPGVYPLEGCEPFTIHFENTTDGGDYYRWEFGDGDTSTAVSPTHTYATGQYGLKFYATSAAGCQDSLIYEQLITVYSSPISRFSWEPVNPTVMHPEVTFHNMTIPQSDENEYYWEIQYDRDNPISYHTLRDVNPSFEWYTDGEDISGTYIARLIAKTENYGPSGKVIECRDTTENTILLVNDFLQFPNVITANGDGINDRFEIKNLITGLGYPSNSLAVYDRWGKRVYYKENISKEEDFWDPAADNVPAGTYFWRFNGKGYLGDVQRNGVVEVLR